MGFPPGWFYFRLRWGEGVGEEGTSGGGRQGDGWRRFKVNSILWEVGPHVTWLNPFHGNKRWLDKTSKHTHSKGISPLQPRSSLLLLLLLLSQNKPKKTPFLKHRIFSACKITHTHTPLLSTSEKLRKKKPPSQEQITNCYFPPPSKKKTKKNQKNKKQIIDAERRCRKILTKNEKQPKRKNKKKTGSPTPPQDLYMAKKRNRFRPTSPPPPCQRLRYLTSFFRFAWIYIYIYIYRNILYRLSSNISGMGSVCGIEGGNVRRGGGNWGRFGMGWMGWDGMKKENNNPNNNLIYVFV